MCGELLTLLRSHLHHRIVIRVVAVEGEREGKRTLLEVNFPFGLDVVTFGYLEVSRMIFVDSRVGEDAIQLHPFGRSTVSLKVGSAAIFAITRVHTEDS